MNKLYMYGSTIEFGITMLWMDELLIDEKASGSWSFYSSSAKHLPPYSSAVSPSS
jgi:hypothetical protein